MDPDAALNRETDFARLELADFDRPGRNGIKVFLCRTPTSVTAEVRINGRPAERASEAMGRLPWPEVTRTAFARFYAVAVPPV